STWFWHYRKTPQISVRSAMTIIVLFGGTPAAHGQDSAGKEEVQNLERNPVLLPTEPPRPKYVLSTQVDYSWVGNAKFNDNNADTRNSRGQSFALGHLGEQTIRGKLDLRV